jgi:hypothetical protein
MEPVMYCIKTRSNTIIIKATGTCRCEYKQELWTFSD